MNMLICDCNIWLKLQASGFWKHLPFAIIMDAVYEDDDEDGDDDLDQEAESAQSSESRQPFANASPMTNEHNASNEAGGPSWSLLSYGAILTYVLSSTSSMRTSSQIQRASSMGWHGWAGTTQLEAKYHQGEVAAMTKHTALQTSMGSSVGIPSSSSTRARTNVDLQGKLSMNNASMAEDSSEDETNHPYVIVKVLVDEARTRPRADETRTGPRALPPPSQAELHHDHFRRQEERAMSEDMKCLEVIDIIDEDNSDQLHDGHEDIRDRRALWAKQSRCMVEHIAQGVSPDCSGWLKAVPMSIHLPVGILTWLNQVHIEGLFDHLDVNNIGWVTHNNGEWVSIPLRGLRPKPAMWQRHHHMFHGTKTMPDVLSIIRDEGKLKPSWPDQAGKACKKRKTQPAIWLADNIWTACHYTRPPVEFVWTLTSRTITRHVNNSRVPCSKQHSWWTVDFDGIALHSLLIRMSEKT